MKTPRIYAWSAFVFSITRAVFLGYVYRDLLMPLGEAVNLEGGLVWGILFGTFFLFLSFLPKPKWAFGLNPVTLTALVWMAYSIGMLFSESVRTNLRAVMISSIFDYFGGVVWILVITWFWHFIVCLHFFEKENPA
jgi:hypothetical protein